MHGQLVSGNFFPDPWNEQEQVRALREQRRMLDALVEDIGRTRRRLDIEPGAGAEWQSAAQKQYMLRRLDLRSRFGQVLWLLEETRGQLTASISEPQSR